MNATSRRRALMLALAVLTGAMASAVSAVPWSDRGSPQGPQYQAKRDKVHIAWQVSLSLKREQEALQILSAGADLETLTVARDVVWDAYVILRAAQNGLHVVLRFGKNPRPNPSLEAQFDRMDRTRQYLRRTAATLDRTKTLLGGGSDGSVAPRLGSDDRRVVQLHGQAVEHLLEAVQEHRAIRIF